MSLVNDAEDTHQEIELGEISLHGDFQNVRTLSEESIIAVAPEGGNSHCFGASVNFVNSIVGSGIISLSFALKETGFFMGLILFVIVPSLTYFSVNILISCGLHSNSPSYEGLAEFCFGRKGFYIVSAFMLVFAFGAMCSYLIIVGDTVTLVVKNVFGKTISRELTIFLFALIVILPLCLLKDMAKLSFSSLVSVSADIAIVIIVLVETGTGADAWETEHDDLPIDTTLKFFGPSLFAGIGAMSFAFVCQHSCFIVFNTLSSPTYGNWKKVNNYSVTVATVASLMLALGGYLTFYDQTLPNLLNNYSDTNLAVNIARFMLALTMVFTFPMEQFVTRHSLYALISGYSPEVEGPKSMTNRYHYGLTLLLWGSSLCVGLLVDDLGFILELTGAFGASFLGYILPSMCYFKLFSFRGLLNKSIGAWRQSSPHYKTTVSERLSAFNAFFPALGMLMFGVVAMIIGTVESFMN